MNAWSKITALAATGVIGVLVAGTAATAAEITAVAGAVPLPEVMGALVPIFERTSGHKVKISFVGAPAMAAQVKEGKADLVVTGEEVVDGFIKDGSVAAGGNAK